MTEKNMNDEIKAWLRQHAMPIEIMTSGKETDDLKPLKRILKSARVVGFAEATHGTREFFHVRHRILKFLVTEMGFKVLAIEGSYSAAQLINDYVLHGRGDRSSVLTGLGFVMWDIQEFSDVLDWLRDHNESVGEDEKVRIYGLDIWNTRVGREKVLAYFRAVAPEKVASIENLFRQIALGESKGMLLAYQQIDEGLFLQLRALLEFLEENRSPMVAQTSIDEYEQAIQHLRVISQWVSANSIDKLTDDWTLNNFARSRYMAENLACFLERDKQDSKVAVWAHIFHLGVGFNDPAHGVMANMGHYLREQLGERYYVFGLELNRGRYLAREWLPDNTLGDFRVGTIPSAPEGSLPWYLSRTDRHTSMLDLREHLEAPLIKPWLMTQQVAHAIGWCYGDPPLFYTQMTIGKCCDGIIFIEDTSATTPTKNAFKTVSERADH